mmetsp:Transcript_40520/g.96293  ORF Transcript_40520/g.96293 Transcript_40520/m.96293 type:complete len:220 (+) Transcript_40520:447-1106(+)
MSRHDATVSAAMTSLRDSVVRLTQASAATVTMPTAWQTATRIRAPSCEVGLSAQPPSEAAAVAQRASASAWSGEKASIADTAEASQAHGARTSLMRALSTRGLAAAAPHAVAEARAPSAPCSLAWSRESPRCEAAPSVALATRAAARAATGHGKEIHSGDGSRQASCPAMLPIRTSIRAATEEAETAAPADSTHSPRNCRTREASSLRRHRMAERGTPL